MTTAPVTPRLAASVLFLNLEAGTPQVLMGRRHPDSRFMPNMRVFPGGAVEDADIINAADEEVDPRLHDLLARDNMQLPAAALPRAALREAEEETGFTLSAEPLNPAQRCQLIARAVTPEALPIRFDTFFFVARIDPMEATRPLRDSDELWQVGWRTLAEARATRIHRITAFLLEHLEDWLARPEATRRIAISRPSMDAMPIEYWP